VLYFHMKDLSVFIKFGVLITLSIATTGLIDSVAAQEVKREREVRVRPAPKPIDATPRRDVQVRSRADAIAHKSGFKAASPKMKALEHLKVKVEIPKPPEVKIIKSRVEEFPIVEPVKQIQVEKAPTFPKMPFQRPGEARDSFFQELIERYFT